MDKTLDKVSDMSILKIRKKNRIDLHCCKCGQTVDIIFIKNGFELKSRITKCPHCKGRLDLPVDYKEIQNLINR